MFYEGIWLSNEPYYSICVGANIRQGVLYWKAKLFNLLIFSFYDNVSLISVAYVYVISLNLQYWIIKVYDLTTIPQNICVEIELIIISFW